MRPAVGTPVSLPASPAVWPRLPGEGILDYLLRLDAAYRQRCALRELDDRLLEDIGVTRADIEAEAAGPLRW